VGHLDDAGVDQYQGQREYRDIGAKLSGKSEIIAVDQEHIKGTIHMTATGSGKKMITDGALTAKWLGSSCANCEIGNSGLSTGGMNRAAGGRSRSSHSVLDAQVVRLRGRPTANCSWSKFCSAPSVS